MFNKFALIISLLGLVACSSADDDPEMIGEDVPTQYGAILTSVACPTFYDWLRPTHIESTDQELTAISFAETHLNCQGNHSINRKTESIFIPLPAGNYFFKQLKASHLFKLTHDEGNAFSFKVAPNRITYIGEIVVKAVPSADIKDQLDLQIEVSDMLGESLMLARKKAPAYMDKYLVDKMLWRPVIETPTIERKVLEIDEQKPWIKDTSPDGFF